VPVFFSTVDIKFNLLHKNNLKRLILLCLKSYNYKLGQINIAFCSDDYILKINKQFLNHNFYTDIITFPYLTKSTISADIIISIDTVNSNAIKYSQTFQKELLRVIIHGVLHLVGFNDKTNEQKSLMRVEEDRWLNFYLSENNEF
jgi:probable rRNA maturation factor